MKLENLMTQIIASITDFWVILLKGVVFKDRVMRLVNENKIILDDEKASSNQISITFGSLDPIQMYISENHEEKPVEQDVDIDGDEGWIFVTRRRRNK